MNPFMTKVGMAIGHQSWVQAHRDRLALALIGVALVLLGASLFLPTYGIDFIGPSHPTATQTGLEYLAGVLGSGFGLVFALPALAALYLMFAWALIAGLHRARLVAALVALIGGLIIGFNGNFIPGVQIGYWAWVFSYIALVLAAALRVSAAITKDAAHANPGVAS